MVLNFAFDQLVHLSSLPLVTETVNCDGCLSVASKLEQHGASFNHLAISRLGKDWALFGPTSPKSQVIDCHMLERTRPSACGGFSSHTEPVDLWCCSLWDEALQNVFFFLSLSVLVKQKQQSPDLFEKSRSFLVHLSGLV